MKVVLFCGGMGTRLREHSDTMPKSLVNIGNRPILWHLMRFYAHHGHRDFIVCLGYRGDMIREYFLNYNEAMSNDFTLSNGGRDITLHSRDLDGWKITFVDTGLHSNIGQRLLRVRKYVADESVFLANYSDALSSLPIDRQLSEFAASDAVGSFAAVRSSQLFHAVESQADGTVTDIAPLSGQDLRINGGFFAFRSRIFDYIEEGEELVEQPFQRLIAQRKLKAFHWDGFWRCMDTFRDKITYDRMEARGDCPWMVWQQQTSPEGRRGS